MKIKLSFSMKSVVCLVAFLLLGLGSYGQIRYLSASEIMKTPSTVVLIAHGKPTIKVFGSDITNYPYVNLSKHVYSGFEKPFATIDEAKGTFTDYSQKENAITSKFPLKALSAEEITKLGLTSTDKNTFGRTRQQVLITVSKKGTKIKGPKIFILQKDVSFDELVEWASSNANNFAVSLLLLE